MDAISIDELAYELAKPGRSQAALARHMRRNPSVVSRLLSGERELRVKELTAIREYLDMTAMGAHATRLQPGEPDANMLLRAALDAIKSSPEHRLLALAISGYLAK